MKKLLRAAALAICAIFMVANAGAQDNYDATTMGEKVYLETASWGQNSPFNKQIFTSYGGSTNAKAGCVPTAYAIVMRYHGFPTEGTTKTLYNCQAPTYVEITDRVYDFSKMPLTYNSDWTQEQIDEVSKFFSHVLHACFPSSIGTGATTVNEGSDSKVLNDYFNYQLINASYQANFTMEQWIEKIKESIDNGCPIPYASDNSGTGDTRHMFVLDGYTANNYFHFNFGWNGSGNGWFKLDAITPSQGDNYSWIDGAEHYALFNLAPNKTMRTVTVSANPAVAGTVTVNDNANSAEVTEGTYATLKATANNGYTFSNWSNGSTDNPLKVKVEAEGNDYVANFYTIGSSVNIPVNYDSNMGSVTYNGNIVSATGFNPNEYSEVTLTAEANDGYMFTGWEIVEGTESTESNDNTVTFIAKNGITVNANFALAGGEYKINKDNITPSGGNNSYCPTWIYNKTGDIEEILTLSTANGSTPVNALSKTSNRLYAHAYDASGSNSFREITYTLTAKEGFVITGYSLTYVVGSSYKGEITVRNATQSLTPNDTEEHTLTYQYANAARSSAYGTRTAEFALSSTTAHNSQYITIKDLTVTVLSEGAEGGSSTPTTKTVTVTFAGATWNNEASGWWESVTTTNEPAVTVATADGGKAIGFSTVNSVRHPYLLDGNSFTISVPANCKITGYTLGYQAHNLVSKSVTYTNGKESTGIVTITQSNEQNTLTVTGLDNNEISFSVEDQSSQAGFIIKSLEITYIEDTNIVTHTVSVTAGENGTATASAETVAEGDNVTLTATANTDYKFVGWYNGETKVSEANPYTFAVTSDISYEARFEELFPDGAYKVYWQADNRGYLAYHGTDYPNEAKLAGVTYSGCQNLHYGINDADLVWYLITASDGKRYLFEVATGKFLGVDTSVQANGTGNKLSTSEAWAIAVEPNTNSTRLGHYIITTMISGTKNLLCSGCGTPKAEHPVRWLPANDNNQKDGGAPLQLIPVNDVTVADNVMNAVLAVINGTDEPEQPTDPLAGKYFRLKEKSTGNYMNIANTSNNTGSTSGVTVVAKNESSNTQIFLFEQSGDGYKLKANSGNYIKCHNWNANANTTDANEATVLTFEPTGNELEYLIKWDNKNTDSNGTELDDYFKVQNVNGTVYVFDNATSGAAATWVLEEVVMQKVYIKAEIEGWENDNPNTHLGTITIGGTAMKLTPAHQTESELTMPLTAGTTLAFTRKYRGFEFNGFYIGTTELGENATLTADNVAAIDENNPLVAKFTATDDVTLFYDDDTYSYRIPAIAKTGTNRLVAVSDYRHSLDDIGRDKHGTGTNRVDLVMRTSDDNGATWSAKQTIAEGTSTFGYGDAAIAANGRDILVMAVAGNVFYPNATATSNNKTYRIYSNNNGESWEKEEVTSNIFGLFDEAYATFFGSGKLAVDPDFNGTGKARVYGAILLKNSARTTNNYVLFSDDWGVTWKILGGSKTHIADADEPKVEILPNGQILLSSRNKNGGSRVFNVFTYGNDKAAGEGAWGTAVSGCSNGGSNGTNGEIICLDAKQTNGKHTKILLQSQPQGGSNLYDRKDVTIWYKELNEDTYTPSSFASGWTMGKQVSTQLSAYSAMALQENGEIAFFFEEAPCYGDDNTKGYSMVYVPLTIEEITGENFLNPNADVEYVPVEFNIELTDEEGNTYRETLDYVPNDAAAVATYLTTTYPFITLGTKGAIADNKYTNTVELPFRVSNNETTVWHNIYWPANGTSDGEFFPIYLMANSKEATYVAKITEKQQYSYSQYNTLEYVEELGWAVYSVDNTLTFKFKNRLTEKFMAVDGIVSSGSANNVIYTDEKNATVFTLTKNPRTNTKCQGDWAITSVHNGTTGYVCNTSAGHPNATNYTGNDHAGAWVKFVEAAEESSIQDLRTVLGSFGERKLHVINDDVQEIITALGNPNNITLNTLVQYGAVLDYAMTYWKTLTLTVNDAMGSVTINNEARKTKKAPSGFEFTVVATPANGYRFTHWSNGTTTVSTDATYRFNMPDAATELTANFEKSSNYYHLISRATDRHEHLYNNAFSNGNTNHLTLQSDAMINTNNGIWHITKNGNQLDIKNGDGKPVVAGNNSGGIMGTYSQLNIAQTINEDYTYYYFTEALNCSNTTSALKVGGVNYLTTWSDGGANATDNQWRLEPVDTEGKNIYDVVVECTEQDVYVTYGSGTNEEYAFNGGFFITDATITAGQLTAKKGNAEAQGVKILVESNTIRVVDAEKRYPEVTGNTNANNYLTSVTTEGGITNVNYSADSHPGEKVVTIGTVQIGRGESFSMKLIAYSLGAGSTSAVREDMRYCHASLFTDFDGDRTFGEAAQTWGVMKPSGTNPYAGGNSNVYGNYDLVMNITANITVPEDAPLGESHVRMIYTNAWKDWPTNGTTTLDKGIVYDIIVEVVEKVTITVGVATENTGTVTINGQTVSTSQVVKSSNVTVEATPASGYHFVNWTDAGGNAVSTDASYTFTASENTSLVANFEADVVYHTITVSTYYNNNGGTVKVGEENATSVNVAEGESVRMLATVAKGYEFMGWLKDGVIVKNAIDGGLDFEVQGPDYTLYEVKASAEYKAVFSKITETTGLEDGKAYRICGVQGNGQARCIYRDGNTLKWKYDYDNNDVNTIFVAQKNGNAINLISAVGYHGWKASYMLSKDEQYNPYAAIKVTYGTRDELRTLYLESGTSSGLFQTNTGGAFSFQNSRGGGLTMVATDEITTDFLFEEVKNYAFQVSAADGSNAKLGTVNLPFATTVPAEVTVYGVNDSNEDYVYVKQLELTDNVLPANTPVLIEAATSGKYGFKPAPASANVYETGWAGTLEAEEIPGTTNAYILSYKGVGTPIKMYKLSSTDRTINANKAYYIDSTGKASALQFVFGGTTDIEDVEREGNEDTIYDLQGRKLSEITEPGFYIIDGKKVWVK